MPLLARTKPKKNLLQSVNPSGGPASFIPNSTTVYFSGNSALSTAYGTCPFDFNKTYTISAYVQMDDRSVPTIGNSGTTGDFCFAMVGVIVASTLTVTALTGDWAGWYRCSGRNLTNPMANNQTGIVKYTGSSAKAFRATNFQLEEGTLTDFEPYALIPDLALAAQVRQGLTRAKKNLITKHDPSSIFDFSANSGVSVVAGFNGFQNSVAYADNATTKYAYFQPQLQLNTQYTLSVFVKMDDNSVPAPNASNTLGDFAFVIAGGAIGPNAVESIGNGVYRCSATWTIPESFSAANTGIVKYNTQSAKGFKVTGYQLEPGPTATPFEPYIAVPDLKQPLQVLQAAR